MRNFIVLLVMIFTTSVFSQTKLNEVIGTYQWCPFHCETIKLNSDFTLDFIVDGDLFNNERAKGNWNFSKTHEIYLKTIEPELDLVFREINKEKQDKLVIQTIDEAGAVFGGIIVSTLENGSKKQFITDENGYVVLPKSNKVIITYKNQDKIYEIRNLDTNNLEVMIRSVSWARIEGNFVFKDKQLCRVNEEGVFEDCFRKLNKKGEKRTFPINKK